MRVPLPSTWEILLKAFIGSKPVGRPSRLFYDKQRQFHLGEDIYFKWPANLPIRRKQYRHDDLYIMAVLLICLLAPGGLNVYNIMQARKGCCRMLSRNSCLTNQYLSFSFRGDHSVFQFVKYPSELRDNYLKFCLIIQPFSFQHTGNILCYSCLPCFGLFGLVKIEQITFLPAGCKRIKGLMYCFVFVQ